MYKNITVLFNALDQEQQCDHNMGLGVYLRA